MRFWIIFGALVGIPLVMPAIISIYVRFVPGVSVGSIDGWLSYLGGYFGGFLAFISAYFIYRTDKDRSEKVWIKIALEEVVSSSEQQTFSVVFSSKNEVNDFDIQKQIVRGWNTYHVVKISLRNMSKIAAAKVNVKYKPQGLKRFISPFVHRENENYLGQYAFMTELESDECFVFFMHLEKGLYPKNDKPSLIEVTSESITGVKNRQLFNFWKCIQGEGFAISNKA